MQTNLPEINSRQAQSIPVRSPACLPDILSIRQQQLTGKNSKTNFRQARQHGEPEKLMAVDFTQAMDVRGRDLAATIAAAKAAGFDTHHMVALPEVVFRMRFWMTNATTGGPEAKAARPDADRVAETFKESFAAPPLAMASGGPEAPHD